MEYPRQLNLQTFEERQETDKWSIEFVQKIHILEKKLEIATKALKDIINDGDDYWDKDKAQEALTKMEGVK